MVRRFSMATVLLCAMAAGFIPSTSLAEDAPKPAAPAVTTPAAPAAPQTPAAPAVPAAPTAAAAAPAPTVDKGDTAWMLTASAFVLLMTPGLAFFYGGLVRRKNVLSVLMQCFMCMCLITIIWVVCGFSMAFGGDAPGLGGFVGSFTQFAFLKGVSFTEPWPALTISGQLFAAFQCMFAIITPGLIIGAFAERMKFAAFTVFTTLWLLIVYCPVAHWVWGGATGFFGLGGEGALDFAGGTVIHINAGVAALICTLVLGKRLGYAQGKISPPHNLPFAVLGAGILWFGWFGFNGGSAGGATDQAVRAFVVTNIAAAAAGFVWALIEWIRNGHPTVLGIITGAVAGLVAITPASGFVDPVGALAIGFGATFISYIFVAFVKPKFGYDDSLDVFGVHGMSGIWGAIATGIFAVKGYGIKQAGGLLEGNSAQLMIQCKAVVYVVIYSAIVSFILLKVTQAIVGLRATERNERVGLDLTDHSEAAYTIIE